LPIISNKPAIATDTGGLGEAVIDGKTGFVVPPDDPRALADAIRRFYMEGKEEEFGREVRNEKRKYSWDTMIENIEALAAEF